LTVPHMVGRVGSVARPSLAEARPFVAKSESICRSNTRFEEAAARVRVSPGESGDGFVTALSYLPTLLF
jgi:hypothetical protein